MSAVEKRDTIRIIAWGGLGDVLLSTPAIRALKEQDPNRKIIVFCPGEKYREIYKHNPYIDQLRSMRWITNLHHYFIYATKPHRFLTLNYGKLSPTKYYSVNARDIIAEMAEVTLSERKMQVFLTEQEENYGQEVMGRFRTPVIIHVTSVSSENQHWPLHYWAGLISEFPDVDFIQVGVTTEKYIEGAIDLRGKSIRETLAMIKYAKSFVGVASFYSHATNAFDIPGVVMMGPSPPWIWGHENNINLFDKSLSCAPCLDELARTPCPYQNECMNNITVSMVSEALRKQLRKEGAGKKGQVRMVLA